MTTILCISVIGFCVMGTAALISIAKSLAAMEIRGVRFYRED